MGAVATPNKDTGISFAEIQKVLMEQGVPFSHAEAQDSRHDSLVRRVLEIHSIYRLKVETKLKPLVDTIAPEKRHLVDNTDRGSVYKALFEDGSIEETEIIYKRTLDA